MLNVLLITLGLAWLTELAGLSLALGAFVAGMLISETEYRYQVEEDIKPFRDVLLGLFFVTIGMMLDVATIVRELRWSSRVLALLLAGKLAVVSGVCRALSARLPARRCAPACGSAPAASSASCCWPAVEAIGAAAGGHRCSRCWRRWCLSHAARAAHRALHRPAGAALRRFGMAAALDAAARSIAARVAWRPTSTPSSAATAAPDSTWRAFWSRKASSYMALDLDPDRVREAAAAGETVVYGDASRRETLIAAGLMRASVVIVTFGDTVATLKVLHQAANCARPAGGGAHHRRRPTSSASPSRRGRSGARGARSQRDAGLACAGPVRRAAATASSSACASCASSTMRCCAASFPAPTDAGDELDEAQQPRLHSVTLTEGDPASRPHPRRPGSGSSWRRRSSAVRRRGMRGLEPDPETRCCNAGDVVVLLGAAGRLSRAEGAAAQGQKRWGNKKARRSGLRSAPRMFFRSAGADRHIVVRHDDVGRSGWTIVARAECQS